MHNALFAMHNVSATITIRVHKALFLINSHKDQDSYTGQVAIAQNNWLAQINILKL